MASTYTISLGDGTLALNDVTGTYVALQVTADSALNADITIKLQHTADGINYFDLPTTEKTLLSGGDSVYIESYDFTLDSLYLYVNVGSATLGTLDVLPSLKKKIDKQVDATISGEVDANITNDILQVSEDSNSTQIVILNKILSEIKLTNKILNKIYQ